MTTEIPHRDWETLSAYLDDQLSPKAHARLEARLDQDSNLNSTLDDLRKTRAVLRSAPKLHTPRNFILTPEMAGVVYPTTRSQAGAFLALRFASVLATFLFIILFAGDLLTRDIQPAQFQALRASQKEAPQTAWPPVGFGGGSGDERPQTEAGIPQNEIVLESQTTATQEEAMALEEPAAVDEEAETLVATPLRMLAATPTPFGMMEQPADAQALLAQDQQPTPIESFNRAFEPTPVVVEAVNVSRGRSILNTFQILLALLAVGAGLGALYLNRSMRP